MKKRAWKPASGLGFRERHRGIVMLSNSRLVKEVISVIIQAMTVGH